jgi:hypothetical protein
VDPFAPLVDTGVKMTYQELLEALQKLTPEQLECDLTVEDKSDGECFPAELRICDVGHMLNINHPVIYF